MSDRDTMTTHEDHLPAASVGAHGTDVAVPEDDPFANPGLPPHLPRTTDIDGRAAKRAERTVAALFTISTLATIGFMVCYTEIPRYETIRVFQIGTVNASNFALGMCLAISMLGIGFGAIHWARRLMSDVEVVDERHPLVSDEESRRAAISEFNQGADDSAIMRRPLIRRSLLGAMAVLPLPALWILRDLGPQPGTLLRNTMWKGGDKLINKDTGLPLQASDIPLGGLAFAVPPGLSEDDPNYDEELNKAAIFLVRLNPSDIQSSRERDWGHQGVVAFSRICTHVGCPIGLYEQQTHHMLCPCHQSTFDIANAGKVIFGPAARSLPQLPITVDSSGNLVAVSDFAEPVGPSFWERG
jgi:ubiquinol-cytochrome c reductase iron-sulfur subunit